MCAALLARFSDNILKRKDFQVCSEVHVTECSVYMITGKLCLYNIHVSQTCTVEPETFTGENLYELAEVLKLSNLKYRLIPTTHTSTKLMFAKGSKSFQRIIFFIGYPSPLFAGDNALSSESADCKMERPGHRGLTGGGIQAQIHVCRCTRSPNNC